MDEVSFPRRTFSRLLALCAMGTVKLSSVLIPMGFVRAAVRTNDLSLALASASLAARRSEEARRKADDQVALARAAASAALDKLAPLEVESLLFLNGRTSSSLDLRQVRWHLVRAQGRLDETERALIGIDGILRTLDECIEADA